MSFAYFGALFPEMRVLIIKECDITTLMSYLQTSSFAREELWENEWFWELKTRRDFSEFMVISFVDAIAIKQSLMPTFPVVWTKQTSTPQEVVASTPLQLPEGWKVVEGWKLNYFHYRSKARIEFINHARDNEGVKVQDYLKAGIDPNSRISSQYVPAYIRGCTALFEASDKGNIGIVKMLLKAGADPNISCDYGWSPLIVASQECYPGIVKLLLKAGANPNFKNGRGETALMRASDQGHPTIVHKLLEVKAYPNIRNREGYTALMYAAARGEVVVVKRLLEYDADPSIINNAGETALEIVQTQNQNGFAKRRKYNEVIDILNEWEPSKK